MQAKLPLSGFRDFLPEEAKVRDYLKKKIKEIFELFGFEPLETPTLERAEVLLGKYGEEAEKLMYLFKDRGGREVGLRYDLTVPTARVLALYSGEKIKLPFKRYQIQNIFRAEKPQKGRYREAVQCDVDIFGSDSPLADAEVLSVVFFALEKLGIKNYTIRINSRKILYSVFEKKNVNEGEAKVILRIIDKLDKKGREGVEKELEEKGFSKDWLSYFSTLQMDDELEKIRSLAVLNGVKEENLKFDPFLVRGLDYYTGMIFEVSVEGFKSSIAGGGRYDNLIKTLGGPNIPAVGGSLGFDRIYDLLRDKLISKLKEKKVFIAIFSKEFLKESLEILQILRRNGIKADICLKDKYDLKKQFKYADQKGFSYVVLVGPEEKEKGLVKIKNLNSGEEQLVENKEVAKILKNEHF